ncbi:serine/arginine repetitive matrix protein 3-like [Apus apus]|uniref:serine/arginine repetitive matrix protein 3-like n=1 Tax=Apus apus TaxID=8895 RepID=UPI0021F8C6A5|nr:serine/arginine repetitive matrix protein 3-like [Apus apus]
MRGAAGARGAARPYLPGTGGRPRFRGAQRAAAPSPGSARGMGRTAFRGARLTCAERRGGRCLRSPLAARAALGADTVLKTLRGSAAARTGRRAGATAPRGSVSQGGGSSSRRVRGAAPRNGRAPGRAVGAPVAAPAGREPGPPRPRGSRTRHRKVLTSPAAAARISSNRPPRMLPWRQRDSAEVARMRGGPVGTDTKLPTRRC